jgi:dienelactone hydrolase
MSIEQALILDDGRVGVLTLPAGAPADTGVVLLNAGAIHRAGPLRLHVNLARQLAGQGYVVLRIDQPGVGDAIASAARPQVAMASELLDRLVRDTGCRRFVVGGICSAADFAWKLALADPRVAGLILLDPLARKDHPAFARGRWRLHWRRGPRSWAGTLLRRLRRSPGAGGAAAGPDDSQLRDWPAAGEEAAQLAALVERGVEVFALYTGGSAAYFLHAEQFLDGFGGAARAPQVAFAHWPDCDHIFYRPQDRERLVAALQAWLTTRLPACG